MDHEMIIGFDIVKKNKIQILNNMGNINIQGNVIERPVTFNVERETSKDEMITKIRDEINEKLKYYEKKVQRDQPIEEETFEIPLRDKKNLEIENTIYPYTYTRN